MLSMIKRLMGMDVCLTGKLETMARSQAKKLIEEAGGGSHRKRQQ